MGTEQGLLGRVARRDTPSLVVYGEYAEAVSVEEPSVQARPADGVAGPRLT